jgi:hypothetical protein
MTTQLLVGILGDLHGNTAAARFMLWSMHRMGVQRVIHVGDFGIYTDNKSMKFASKVNEYAKEYGITLIVVPGNHENWRVINEMVGDDRENLVAYRSNIFIAPRGYRWDWWSMSFLALGGAPSVDRTWRLQLDNRSKDKYKANQLWYAEEQITQADVDYVVAGGYADVMIGHDAPHGIRGIERAIQGNPHGFHMADLLYAEEGRLLMTEAFRGVAPEFFFHGHYHTAVNENIQRPGGQYGDITHVIGLNCEFNNYSMAVLDTETRTARNIDHNDLLTEFRGELNGNRSW